jgi:hypothetical protein
MSGIMIKADNRISFVIMGSLRSFRSLAMTRIDCSTMHGLSCLNYLLALFATMVCLPMPLHCAEIKLIPQLSIRDQYNDNIFYDSSNDSKVHDLVAIVSPSLKLTDRTERLNASLQSTFQRTEYRDQKDLDATNQFHAGSIGYRLTQNMNVSADARYARDSQIDRDFETTGLVFDTATRKRQHYGCSTDAALTEKTLFSTSYAYDKDTFSNLRYSDSTIQNISLTLAHNLDALVSQTTVRLTPGYALYVYPDTDVTSYSIMAGASKRITEKINLSADLGSQVDRTKNVLFHVFEQRETTRGLRGQVVLSYRGEATNSSISYYRDLRSISGEVGLARYSSVSFNINSRFTYEITGDLTTQYFTYKKDAEMFVSSGIDETSVQIQPRLIYNYSTDLRIEASYRLARIRYKDDDRTASQNLYFLNVAWQYPIPH